VGLNRRKKEKVWKGIWKTKEENSIKERQRWTGRSELGNLQLTLCFMRTLKRSENTHTHTHTHTHTKKKKNVF